MKVQIRGLWRATKDLTDEGTHNHENQIGFDKDGIVSKCKICEKNTSSNILKESNTIIQ